MKLLFITLLALAAVANSTNIDLEDVLELEKSTKYSYVEIPEAEKENRLEASRILGGSLAAAGQFPYQTGLLLYNAAGGLALGSGVLLSSTRVLTAAHNWFNGYDQRVMVTVVLGTTNVFSDGDHYDTTDVIMHENYSPTPLRNDIAMIRLSTDVTFSDVVSPISLPSGADLNEDFVGETAVASGFGKTSDEFPTEFPLNFVNLPVISNDECQRIYGETIQPWVLCTSGANGNICTGDSGGPLAIVRGDTRILIGITSFGQAWCSNTDPAGFARVTFYSDWIANLM